MANKNVILVAQKRGKKGPHKKKATITTKRLTSYVRTGGLGDDTRIYVPASRDTMVESKESYGTGTSSSTTPTHLHRWQLTRSRCSQTVQWLTAPQLPTIVFVAIPGFQCQKNKSCRPPCTYGNTAVNRNRNLHFVYTYNIYIYIYTCEVVPSTAR